MKKICAFILIFSLVFAFCSCGKALKIDVHMFSDIEECNNIVSSKENEAQINYLSAEEDKNSKDLKYEEFFGCKYICEELSFEIFAYSFSNSELAMDYFKNVTGKKNDPNPTFSDNSGGKFFNRVVVSDNKVYNVRCGKKCKESVIDFLNGVFSIELFN